jgi:hypothetical protein
MRRPWMVLLAGAISAGALFLVFIDSDIYRSIAEHRHRKEVLAHGKSAVAIVQKQSGKDSIVISWIDSDGRRRAAEALTGKQLARSPPAAPPTVASNPQPVEIKYVDDPDIRPVVLSEVAEREQIDSFYFYWNPLFYVLSGLGLAGALWLSTKLPARPSI